MPPGHPTRRSPPSVPARRRPSRPVPRRRPSFRPGPSPQRWVVDGAGRVSEVLRHRVMRVRSSRPVPAERGRRGQRDRRRSRSPTPKRRRTRTTSESRESRGRSPRRHRRHRSRGPRPDRLRRRSRSPPRRLRQNEEERDRRVVSLRAASPLPPQRPRSSCAGERLVSRVRLPSPRGLPRCSHRGIGPPPSTHRVTGSRRDTPPR